MINEEKLNRINADAGQCCTVALSKLINTEIEVAFFNPVITNVKEISSVINFQELGVGIYLPISGNVTGLGFFFFPKETSTKLCDLAMKKGFRITQALSTFDEGVLKEIGNILLGNYLTILSNNLKGEITGGMPKLSSGMISAMLEEIIADFAKGVNEMLVVKIEIAVAGKMTMKGYLLFIFKPEEIKILMNAL